ncbi:MAG: TolC family protein [Bacteroidetes bacterium]|nr:TolC family protein [Bacteroidota bacterium]
MNFFKNILGFILIIIVLKVSAQSDTNLLKNINEYNPSVHSISLILPPLQVLFDSAIEKSSLIKFWESGIDAQQYKIQSARINWMRSVNLEGDFRYGSINNVFVGPTSTLITTSDATRWGTGISLKLPIYEFFNKKNAVGVAVKEKEQASFQREAAITELKKAVISQYYELLFREQSLKIRNSNMQSTALQLQMTELDFKNGKIAISELVRLSQQHAANQFEFEKEKREFLAALLILEEIIGFKLIK